MILKEISIITTYNHPYQLMFNKETWCVSELFVKCLGKFNSGHFNKIVIRLGDNESVLDNKVDNLIDVVLLNKFFDFNTYFVNNKIARKVILLDVLYNNLLYLANIYYWHIDQITNAYRLCKEKNIEYQWILRNKLIRSPDHKYYAAVFCNWDIDRFEAYIILYNSQKIEISRKKIMESEPHLVEPFGKIAWENGNKFVVSSKDTEREWILNI